MIDLKKLKHEWKTFTFGILTFVVGLWDAASASGYDLSPIIPEEYRTYAVPVVGITFLALRQYRNSNVDHH